MGIDIHRKELLFQSLNPANPSKIALLGVAHEILGSHSRRFESILLGAILLNPTATLLRAAKIVPGEAFGRTRFDQCHYYTDVLEAGFPGCACSSADCFCCSGGIATTSFLYAGFVSKLDANRLWRWNYFVVRIFMRNAVAVGNRSDTIEGFTPQLYKPINRISPTVGLIKFNFNFLLL